MNWGMSQEVAAEKDKNDHDHDVDDHDVDDHDVDDHDVDDHDDGCVTSLSPFSLLFPEQNSPLKQGYFLKLPQNRDIF